MTTFGKPGGKQLHAIVAETMACLAAGELIVSDHGLREGLLLEACAPGPRFDRVPGDV